MGQNPRTPRHWWREGANGQRMVIQAGSSFGMLNFVSFIATPTPKRSNFTACRCLSKKKVDFSSFYPNEDQFDECQHFYSFKVVFWTWNSIELVACFCFRRGICTLHKQGRNYGRYNSQLFYFFRIWINLGLSWVFLCSYHPFFYGVGGRGVSWFGLPT